MSNVSVVIPLYNKAKYITRAVKSVINQTFQDFELIIVDDGSTDASLDAVNKINDQRIKIISQENAGPGAARNHGLKEAQSSLVTFLDADDEFLPTFLEVTTNFLDLNPKCASVTTGFLQYPSGRPSIEIYGKRYGLTGGIHELQPHTPAKLAHFLQVYMNPWSTLCRTEILRYFGGFMENHCNYGEDQFLYIKLAFNQKFGIIMEPHAIYHTEASELAANRLSVRPVIPFLIDPEPIYKNCPRDKIKLLERTLEFKASLVARYYLQDVTPPDINAAKNLLKRFPYVGGDLYARIITLLWLYTNRLSRIIRPIKRMLKPPP